MRTFHVMGNAVYFDGRHVATLDNGINATLRDDVVTFLHGRDLYCCDVVRDEGRKAASKEWFEGYEAGLQDGRDGRDDAERARL